LAGHRKAISSTAILILVNGAACLGFAGRAEFYARVGALGRIFAEIETEAFPLPA
jgi:hypothetical protein